MVEAFLSGGVIMWPLLVIAIGVVVLIVREALARRRGPGEGARGRPSMILFWGGAGAVLGLLGTVVGLLQMARAIQRAGAVAPELVWGGTALTLVSLIFGLLILLVAGLGWLAVRPRGPSAT